MIPSIRILSDGKAGDEVQCLGLAEAMGVDPDIRRISPRKPYTWLMPWGPIDPKDGSDSPNSPLAPPYPDIAIATGRRTVPYIRKIRNVSEGVTMTVFLKDPRTGTNTADLIWVQEHDRLRGENVIVTTTAPNRINKEKLDRARANPEPEIAKLSPPRILVLVGGNSRHHHFTSDDIRRFGEGLDKLIQQGSSLMITTSRRTSPELEQALTGLVGSGNHILWTGGTGNPYMQFLAAAEYIVVTADSTNMVGEALTTGKPVLVFKPSGGHRKIDQFLTNLSHSGAISEFTGVLENLTYEPINSTQLIADTIRKKFDDKINRV